MSFIMAKAQKHKGFREKMVTRTREGRSMLLDCPHCQTLVSAKDINLDSGEAHCSHCGQVFDFEDEIKKDPFRRPEIVMPEGVDVLKLSSMLDIVVDWYQAAPKRRIGSMVFSSFFWNIVLIPLILFLAFNGQFVMVLFFFGHVLTGLALVAYLIALFLNKTHIEVTEEGINLRHEPIPTPFNKDIHIPKSSIAQLYVSKYTQRFGRERKKGIEAYALHAVTTNGKVIDLVKGMNAEAQLFLEQEIETYLKIKDVPVRGEIKRK